MLAGPWRWISVVLLAGAGIGGLFYAAKGGTEDAATMGLGLFVIALAWIAVIIRRGCDAADAAVSTK